MSLFAPLEVSFNRIEVVLDLVEEPDVFLHDPSLHFMPLILFLILQLVLLPHLFVHLVRLVLHLAADLALSPHLISPLLFLLLLLINGLLSDLSLLALPDLLRCRVNLAD